MIRGKMIRRVILLLVFFASSLCVGKGILEDFNSLGGNDTLLQKAQVLAPQSQVKIVQKRIVQRFNRHELSPEIGFTSWGTTYFNTSSVALGYHYHINPHWSVGLKYSYYLNKLTPEGDKVIERAIEAVNQGKMGDDLAAIPAMNWPEQSYVVQLHWYPIYGKLNVYNKGVVHFDIYTILGIGQIDLRNEETMIYQAGMGVGFWISQHLTSRMEYKYKTYDVELYSGTRTMNTHELGLSIGYML